MRAEAVRAVWVVWAVRAAGVGHGLEPVKHCFSWQGRCKEVRAVGAVRAVWQGCFSWQGRGGGQVRAVGGGEGGVDGARKTLLFMEGRCGGGGEGGVGGVGGEGGEGGGGWSWTGACKTLLFMAGRCGVGGEGRGR